MGRFPEAPRHQGFESQFEKQAQEELIQSVSNLWQTEEIQRVFTDEQLRKRFTEIRGGMSYPHIKLLRISDSIGIAHDSSWLVFSEHGPAILYYGENIHSGPYISVNKLPHTNGAIDKSAFVRNPGTGQGLQLADLSLNSVVDRLGIALYLARETIKEFDEIVK